MTGGCNINARLDAIAAHTIAADMFQVDMYLVEGTFFKAVLD